MAKIKNIILNNAGLKILSLVLAIVLWLYIRGELNRLALEEEMGLTGAISYKITAKVFPIIADIRGNVAPGYNINKDKIEVKPPVCSVIGPQRLLDKMDFIKTVPIDISEYTKTFTVRASLRSPARGVKVVDKFTTIIIPIEKITDKKEEDKPL